MQLQSVVDKPKNECPTDVKEMVFTGRVDANEVRLAQNDPVAFLKCAGIDVPEDAQIHVSVHNYSAAAARVSRALLCRVTIICIGNICVIQITCIPVIVIAT
jgi:hypothetical protein